MNGLDHFENKVKEAIQKSEVPYLGLVDDLLTNDARSFVELALIKSGGQLRNFEKGLKIAPALFVGYISSILRLHLGADTSAVYGCLNIAMGKPADSNQTNEEREGLWRAFRSACQKLGLPLSSRHFGPNYMVDAYLEQAGIPEAGMPELIKRMDIYAKKYGLPELGDVLPTLLNPLRRKVKQVSADGAYDTKKCHKLLKRRGCKPTIPPRKNAGYWEEGHPRNEAVSALKSDELKQWKQENDYHQRSLSETAMYRYKQLISPKLSLRDYNGQVGEALAGVKVMNKVIGLGMPIRQRVN